MALSNNRKVITMAKAVNYTAEQVKALVQAYVNAKTDDTRAGVVESFSERLGKSVASIRAKLSREGVYVKKETATKKRSKTLKSEKVTKLATLMNKDEELIGDAEKLTHRTLDFLIEALS